MHGLLLHYWEAIHQGDWELGHGRFSLSSAVEERRREARSRSACFHPPHVRPLCMVEGELGDHTSSAAVLAQLWSVPSWREEGNSVMNAWRRELGLLHALPTAELGSFHALPLAELIPLYALPTAELSLCRKMGRSAHVQHRKMGSICRMHSRVRPSRELEV
ncbi:hypothetical protein Dimus_003904 [Dionaea muscipula]